MTTMKRCDTLFSKYVRARDGACQAAGYDRDCKGVLQCAHIIGRGELGIRVDPENAVALCQGHHLYFTHRPAAWFDFVDIRYPGRMDVLRGRVRERRQQKVDWSAEHVRLAALLEEWA